MSSFPSPEFNSVTLDNPLSISGGGTGVASLTAHAVVIGEGTSAPNFAAPGAANTALLSTGASADPSFQQLTAPIINYTQGGTGAITQTVQTRLRNMVVAGDVGVVSDGVTDDSAAINTALTNGTALFPPRTTLSNTASSVTNQRWASFGGDFTGANPVDKNVSVFGPGVFRAGSTGAYNCIIGSAYNNSPANTAVFPTGVTGYGRMDNAGNTVFGLFGRADMYASGTATSEINTFNFAGAPSIALPPDRSFGTSAINPITLTVAAAGTFPNSIGIHISREGSQPQPYLTGIYTSPDAVTSFGIMIGANASQSPNTSAVFQNSGAGINLLLQTMGTAAPSNSMLSCNNAGGSTIFSIKQSGQLFFTSAIVQSSATAGSASALPSAPANYLQIQIDGAVKKIPYYNS